MIYISVKVTRYLAQFDSNSHVMKVVWEEWEGRAGSS